MKDLEHKYKEILYSFLYRDEIYPAIRKNKGFNIIEVSKVIYRSFKADFNDLLSYNDNKSLNNKVWIYVESINQLRASEFLTALNDTVIVTNSKELIKFFPEKNIQRIIYKNRIRERINWFTRYWMYKRLFRKRFIIHFSTIFQFDGIYELLNKIIKKTTPRAIIMANDHNAMCRALLLVANESKIPSIYLQHASVTDQFPPLDFYLSILEGNDSYNKYFKAGPINGKVELVGMPKFDNYISKINKKGKVRSIGIALSIEDDISAYLSLCELIKAEYMDFNFIFRFHPSINLDYIHLPKYCDLSKTNEETSFDFLERVDVLLAGNSSIHLEATLMNVLSVYIGFANVTEIDYYGFLKNGLIDMIPYNEITNWLATVKESKPNVRYRAKYYVDTVGTDWDGKSTERVLQLLKECL